MAFISRSDGDALGTEAQSRLTLLVLVCVSLHWIIGRLNSTQIQSFFRWSGLLHECELAVSLTPLTQLLLRYRVRVLFLLLFFDQLLSQVLIQDRVSNVAQVVLVRGLFYVLLLNLI